MWRFGLPEKKCCQSEQKETEKGKEMWLIWGSKSNKNVCLVTSAPGSPTITFLCSAFVSLSQIPVQILPPLSLSASSPLSQCSKVFLAVWRDSKALVQTGYSSAQGQCTGQGRVGGEGGRERRDGLSTAQLREGRQGQVLWVVCVYVSAVYLCICMLAVLMYLSLQRCRRGQRTSTSLLLAHSRLQMNMASSFSFTVSLTSNSHQSNTCQTWREYSVSLFTRVDNENVLQIWRASERSWMCKCCSTACAGVWALQRCNNIASNAQACDSLEGAWFEGNDRQRNAWMVCVCVCVCEYECVCLHA